MATLAATEYHLPEPNYRNFDPKTDPHEVAFADLLAKSHALPDGQIVGAMLKWQRADGGLRKQDVADKVAQERRFAALFAGR